VKQVFEKSLGAKIVLCHTLTT